MNNNVFTVSKIILTDAKNKQTLYLQYRYLKVSTLVKYFSVVTKIITGGQQLCEFHQRLK